MSVGKKLGVEKRKQNAKRKRWYDHQNTPGEFG